MKLRTILRIILVIALCTVFIYGCNTSADIASRNLSQDAEEFKIIRRISFYNGITDNIMVTVEGRCSVEFYSNKFEVTCKLDDDSYAKHYLGRSDNSFPIVEQIIGADINTSHHKIIYRPQSLIPDIDIKVSDKDFKDLLK